MPLCACGARSLSNEFDDADVEGGAGSSSGGAASGSGSGSGSSGSSGSSSGGTGSGAGSSSSSSSGARVDAGSADAGAAGSAVEAGSAPVACDTGGSCRAPDVCCAGGGANGDDICATQAACTRARGDLYLCTSSTTCTNRQICCVTFGAGPMGTDLAQCENTCVPTPTGDGPYQVCAQSSECPRGQTCRPIASAAMNVCQ